MHVYLLLVATVNSLLLMFKGEVSYFNSWVCICTLKQVLLAIPLKTLKDGFLLCIKSKIRDKIYILSFVFSYSKFHLHKLSEFLLKFCLSTAAQNTNTVKGYSKNTNF